MRCFLSRGLLPALLSSTLVACAHTTDFESSTFSPRPQFVAETSRVLSRLELRNTAGTLGLYDAVALLRPTFVYFRGARPSIVVDGVGYGSLESLDHIPVESVETIRLLSGPDATLRYGPRHSGALLVVTTRRR